MSFAVAIAVQVLRLHRMHEMQTNVTDKVQSVNQSVTRLNSAARAVCTVSIRCSICQITLACLDLKSKP